MSKAKDRARTEAETRVGLFKRALTHALVDGRLPRWLAPQVHRRVLADGAWRAEYEALRQAERVAANAPPVTKAQVDLLEALVLQEVATSSPTAESAGRRLLAWTAVATAACVLVAVGFSALLPPREADVAWRARGAGDEAPALGLKLRCVAKDRTRVLDDAEAGARQLEDRLSCPHGGLLSFSVTNLDDAPRYLFAVGVSESQELRWYAPFTKSGRSLKVEPGAVDRHLETLADTGELPKDERVSLFVLYSSKPLTGHEIEAQLERAPAREHLGKAARLPIPAEVQARIELLPGVADR